MICDISCGVRLASRACCRLRDCYCVRMSVHAHHRLHRRVSAARVSRNAPLDGAVLQFRCWSHGSLSHWPRPVTMANSYVLRDQATVRCCIVLIVASACPRRTYDQKWQEAMAELNEQVHIEDDTLDLEEGDEPPPVRCSQQVDCVVLA